MKIFLLDWQKLRLVLLSVVLFLMANLSLAQSDSEKMLGKSSFMKKDESINFKLIEDIFYSLDSTDFSEKWLLDRVFAKITQRYRSDKWERFEFYESGVDSWSGFATKYIYPDRYFFRLSFRINEGVCIGPDYFFERIKIGFSPNKKWVFSSPHGPRKMDRHVYTSTFKRMDFDGKNKVSISVLFDLLDGVDCLSSIVYDL